MELIVFVGELSRCLRDRRARSLGRLNKEARRFAITLSGLEDTIWGLPALSVEEAGGVVSRKGKSKKIMSPTHKTINPSLNNVFFIAIPVV